MDKKRILSKIDELNGYLEELGEVRPLGFKEYKTIIEKKRACERLLQISIESVIDICNQIISELKLGLPSDEDDIFEKLEDKKIITRKLANTLSDMKGFRNILVHKYGKINDELVFENLDKLEDFDKFVEEILKFLKGF